MTGQELKELRNKLRLTQSQMAERLGITISAVFKLESGENNMSKPVSMLCHQLETAHAIIKDDSPPF